MADNLPQFPLVELEDDSPEEIGKAGLYDFVMEVGTSGIIFVAALQGVLMSWGPVFPLSSQQAAMLRAASTLSHWGLIRGDTFTFLRDGAQLSQADLATQMGVATIDIQNWESGTVEIPRLAWAYLADLVCALDGRSPLTEYPVNPDFRARRIRIFPNIIMHTTPQGPPTICPPEPPLC